MAAGLSVAERGISRIYKAREDNAASVKSDGPVAWTQAHCDHWYSDSHMRCRAKGLNLRGIPVIANLSPWFGEVNVAARLVFLA